MRYKNITVMLGTLCNGRLFQKRYGGFMENNWLMDNISFREFKEADYRFMLKWLSTDFVKQWYYKSIDWTYERIADWCKPFTQKQNTDGSPLESFIILYNDKEMGYIQTSLLKDAPEYNELLQGGDDSADIDLFIGEEEFIYKGLGPIIIKKFIENKVFENKNINKCIIATVSKNVAAIKAFEKAGFKFMRTIEDHVNSGGALVNIMELLRNKFE
jgi:RimJ/RimL family protein N-acetyltransferase